MAMTEKQSIIPVERIASRICLVRRQSVMLDSDLAALYGVETGVLNRAVKRNRDRFPSDFMFQLTHQEVADLRCQFGISSSTFGGRRYLPYAFTEQGVAMLSSVLNSPRAVQVNIAIMRVFVRLRHCLASNAEVARRLREHDAQIQTLFEAIHELMNPAKLPPKQIGFQVRERRTAYRSLGRRGSL
jgi:hypothetical protein